jgi:ribonuclease VapC
VIIFADASALVAIISGEADANELADCIELANLRLCSAISAWETMAGLCRSYSFTVPKARSVVQRLLSAGDFEVMTIGEREFEIAADAYARYGKGRHAASLNMGDCFAYAYAKSRGAKLLFKGADFSSMGIESAFSA